MLKAVVLEILIKVALIAIQNEQLVYPYLVRLCICIKVLQPL
jgi:hypothetical protein